MNQRHATRRNGAILVMALVCLLVVGIFSASTIRRLVEQRRLATHQQYRLQTLWLAESARQRAVAKLNLDRNYEGETWRVEADTFGDGKSGIAIIQVAEITEDHSQRRIMIESQYPESELYRAVHRIGQQVELPETGDRTTDDASWRGLWSQSEVARAGGPCYGSGRTAREF